MIEIRFYHLQRRPLAQALPQLLHKILEKGHRVVLLAGSPERVEDLNRHLWCYEESSFLPHGSQKDGNADLQPIWLTAHEENPNGADVLVCIDGMEPAQPETFAIVCDMFDGNDPEALQAARTRWRSGKAAGRALAYWQQSPNGGWVRKS